MADFTDETTEENQEERIAYLRSKGIQIEIPGEKRGHVTGADKSLLTTMKVVRIPCDDRMPYEEIEVEIDATIPGDALLQSLKPYISASSRSSSFDMKSLKATAAAQFGNAPVTLTDETLKIMSEQAGTCISYGALEYRKSIP